MSLAVEPIRFLTNGMLTNASTTLSANCAKALGYEGQDPHHFYDFGEWAGIVATDSKALDNFNTALQECVIAKYTLPEFYSAYGSYGTYPINEEVYSGVTTSAPSTAFPNGWMQTNWYKEVFE